MLHATQQVLVDTGLPTSRGAFLEALGSVIDPADLRWIWISHADRDHIGSLYELLDVAPQARVVITFESRGSSISNARCQFIGSTCSILGSPWISVTAT